MISGDSAADKTLPPAPYADGLGQVPAGAPFSDATARVPVAVRAVLEPPARWSGFEFRELWQYRELLYILAWRDMEKFGRMRPPQ